MVCPAILSIRQPFSFFQDDLSPSSHESPHHRRDISESSDSTIEEKFRVISEFPPKRGSDCLKSFEFMLRFLNCKDGVEGDTVVSHFVDARGQTEPITNDILFIKTFSRYSAIKEIQKGKVCLRFFKYQWSQNCLCHMHRFQN